MASPSPRKHFITDQEDENESLLIHDIARLFSKNFDRRVRKLGLTRAQWLAIGTLRRNPGISQAQLADKLDVEPITIARTIDRLEKSGWIERRPDPTDRRVKRLYLTARVKDVVVRMRALAMEMRREIVSDIGRQEHQALVRSLRHIKHKLCTMTKAD